MIYLLAKFDASIRNPSGIVTDQIEYNSIELEKNIRMKLGLIGNFYGSIDEIDHVIQFFKI